MFDMQSCSSVKVTIVKRDSFSKGQYPHNDIEGDQMKIVSYSSGVGSLMYVQVCKRFDIAFVANMLVRYLSDLGQIHQKAVNRVLRYLQGTKDLMFTYQCSDTLEVVGFSDSDYGDCVDDNKSTFSYIILMAERVCFMDKCKADTINFFTIEVKYVICYGATYHALQL